jgi:hypothetical protein
MFQRRRWSQQLPLKHQYTTTLHAATTQKAAIFILVTVETSNLNVQEFSSYYKSGCWQEAKYKPDKAASATQSDLECPLFMVCQLTVVYCCSACSKHQWAIFHVWTVVSWQLSRNVFCICVQILHSGKSSHTCGQTRICYQFDHCL